MGVELVRWEKGGTERVEDYTLFYEEGNGDFQLETGFSYIKESYEPLEEWSLLVIGCRV
jgi:hypothetical protein